MKSPVTMTSLRKRHFVGAGPARERVAKATRQHTKLELAGSPAGLCI